MYDGQNACRKKNKTYKPQEGLTKHTAAVHVYISRTNRAVLKCIYVIATFDRFIVTLSEAFSITLCGMVMRTYSLDFFLECVKHLTYSPQSPSKATRTVVETKGEISAY